MTLSLLIIATKIKQWLCILIAGQSNSNFDTCNEFRVKYLGAIENLKASLVECLQGPQDLINYIDLAQV